jgi:hypothetical protein
MDLWILWTSRFVDAWINGSTKQWSYEPIDQRINGSMDSVDSMDSMDFVRSMVSMDSIDQLIIGSMGNG